jgi:hypothetical protein
LVSVYFDGIVCKNNMYLIKYILVSVYFGGIIGKIICILSNTY